eukprot:jgi/Chlat1/8870/Chrsp92S09259
MLCHSQSLLRSTIRATTVHPSQLLLVHRRGSLKPAHQAVKRLPQSTSISCTHTASPPTSSPSFSSTSPPNMAFDIPPYPLARRDESVVDTLHGQAVADPYRWLEDPDAPETKVFVEAQSAVTQKVLSQCPTRDQFKQKMTRLFDYPKYGCPFRRGDSYFYFFNTGLQAQSVLYSVKGDDARSEEAAAVLLDPNALSSDGTIALASYDISRDGRHLAYGLSSGGSDWQTLHVMRVEGREVMEDTLAWAKFTSPTWTHDSKGFFYNRFPEPSGGEAVDAGTETDTNVNQELWYHLLGTPQSEDVLCYRIPEHPTWMTGSTVTDDGRYLVLSITEGCQPTNRLYYCDLEALPGGLEGLRGSDKLLPVVKLVDNFDAQYDYIANDGAEFTFHTNKDAPLYKVVRVDLKAKEPEWRDVIEQHASDVLEWARCVANDKLLLCYLHDVKNILQLHRLSGSLDRPIPLDIGSVGSVTGRREDTTIFYSFTSFTRPSTIYKVDLSAESAEPSVFRSVKIEGFDPDAFESTQVFAKSKDGTRVPMFIVSKKGLAHNGDNATLLYAYGGFNISITPYFSVSYLMWMLHYNGVLAVANIRGGGEYGQKWRDAGSLANKQNCFDDFQSCAAHLVENGYTKPSKLGIMGGSNGGLLVGACINQRPDLFGCAIAHVGVMDMLRFHLFTIGHAWTTDYGCADKAEEFSWLIKYSPLHNVRRPESGQYPAVMLLTGDHDDRVVPLHTLKFGATLQYELCGEGAREWRGRQTNPIVMRIDVKSGHGAGKPTAKVIEEAADVYSFLAKCLGQDWVE